MSSGLATTWATGLNSVFLNKNAFSFNIHIKIMLSDVNSDYAEISMSACFAVEKTICSRLPLTVYFDLLVLSYQDKAVTFFSIRHCCSDERMQT